MSSDTKVSDRIVDDTDEDCYYFVNDINSNDLDNYVVLSKPSYSDDDEGIEVDENTVEINNKIQLTKEKKKTDEHVQVKNKSTYVSSPNNLSICIGYEQILQHQLKITASIILFVVFILACSFIVSGSTLLVLVRLGTDSNGIIINNDSHQQQQQVLLSEHGNDNFSLLTKEVNENEDTSTDIHTIEIRDDTNFDTNDKGQTIDINTINVQQIDKFVSTMDMFHHDHTSDKHRTSTSRRMKNDNVQRYGTSRIASRNSNQYETYQENTNSKPVFVPMKDMNKIMQKFHHHHHHHHQQQQEEDRNVLSSVDVSTRNQQNFMKKFHHHHHHHYQQHVDPSYASSAKGHHSYRHNSSHKRNKNHVEMLRGKKHMGRSDSTKITSKGTSSSIHRMNEQMIGRVQSSMLSSSTSSFQNRDDSVNHILDMVQTTRELRTTTTTSTSLSFDNFGSFLNTQTQPPGSDNRVVLIFYKSSDVSSTSSTSILDDVATLPNVHGISIGTIDCTFSFRLCNENSVKDYPTIRIYKQRLPKLDSTSTKQPVLTRYFYSTIANIDELDNQLTVALSSLSTTMTRQYPSLLPRMDTGVVVVATEKRQLEKMKARSRGYPPLLESVNDHQRKLVQATDDATIDKRNESHQKHVKDSLFQILHDHKNQVLGHQRIPKKQHPDQLQQQQHHHQQERKQQAGIDSKSVTMLSYKSFRDFFIGNLQERNNRILMVFYKPTKEFNNTVAPIVNRIATHNSKHHVGIVDCSNYRQICRSHSIKQYPTIRWYMYSSRTSTDSSSSSRSNSRGSSNGTMKRRSGSHKALLYETTTIDKLELYLVGKEIDSHSTINKSSMISQS